MISVLKATGEKEVFDENKLRGSIQRAGIPEDLQDQVLAHIKEKLYDNIPTAEIYNHITEFLNKKHPLSVSRYGLKSAIMDLGPTGYPFEDFVAKVLQAQGYKTTLRSILQGKCITHEVDVVAQKGTSRIMVEVKYHNLPGTKTNVHVALYTKARFNDLLDKNNLNQAWLITNTKVTIDAISYALCMGMKVISWNYPEGESLRELIERSNLIPITSLTFLSNVHKQKLLENNIVLAKDLCNNPKVLSLLNLSEEEKKRLMSEAQFACKI